MNNPLPPRWCKHPQCFPTSHYCTCIKAPSSPSYPKFPSGIIIHKTVGLKLEHSSITDCVSVDMQHRPLKQQPNICPAVPVLAFLMAVSCPYTITHTDKRHMTKETRLWVNECAIGKQDYDWRWGEVQGRRVDLPSNSKHTWEKRWGGLLADKTGWPTDTLYFL